MKLNQLGVVLLRIIELSSLNWIDVLPMDELLLNLLGSFAMLEGISDHCPLVVHFKKDVRIHRV